MRMTIKQFVIGTRRIVSKGFGSGLKEFKIKVLIKYPDYSIGEIGQNTKKWSW